MKTENKYIKIGETLHTGKTRGFDIVNKSSNDLIGYIEWYRNWRQYCFFPYEDMVFNSECLELITEFLKEINIEHRKSWNQKKIDA